MVRVWVVPQGLAMGSHTPGLPALHWGLNDVPEMQHWPGGNDMPRACDKAQRAQHWQWAGWERAARARRGGMH